jgi:hypothetical protein
MATDNLKQFTADVSRFADAGPKVISTIQRKLAFDAVRDLVKTTPVGNPDLWEANVGSGRVGNADRVLGDYDYVGQGYVGGHARRNWILTIGQPAVAEREGVDPSGREAIGGASAALKALPKFSVVWISNNVPYIEKLDQGHSTQAPFGMLDQAFYRMRLNFNRIASRAIKEHRL